MKRYNIKETRTENGILYLTLQPNREKDKFNFYSGQYATIGFRSSTGRRSPMRCFSIVSSPYSSSNLQFAIRLQGNFTTTLSELPIGSDMFVQGPFGDFVVDEKTDKRLVLLAGGIGITPCISIARSLTLKGSQLPLTVLHSYRTSKIPFKEELEALKKRNPKLHVYHFVTRDPVPAGEVNVVSGVIKEDHIKQLTSNKYVGSTYFVCGPKPFMDAMTELLLAQGVRDDQIITESFTQSAKVYTDNGYSIHKLTYAFASALLLVGVLGITSLDLSRYVSKVASAQPSTISSSSNNNSGITTTNTGSASSNNSSNSSATNTNSTSTTSSSSSNSTSSSAPTTSSSQSTYQAPVTAVS